MRHWEPPTAVPALQPSSGLGLLTSVGHLCPAARRQVEPRPLLSAPRAGEPQEGRRPLGTFPRDVALQLDAASLSATSPLGVVSQGGPRAPGEPGVGHLGIWAWDSPQPPNTCPGAMVSTTGHCQGCYPPPRAAGPDERSTVEPRLGGPGASSASEDLGPQQEWSPLQGHRLVPSEMLGAAVIMGGPGPSRD